MTHSHSELRKPQVEQLWTIFSLDKNASRLALLYEMLPSFQKNGISVFDQMMYRSQASRSPLAAPSWNGSGMYQSKRLFSKNETIYSN